jgi:hypothetical protein
MHLSDPGARFLGKADSGAGTGCGQRVLKTPPFALSSKISEFHLMASMGVAAWRRGQPPLMTRRRMAANCKTNCLK